MALATIYDLRGRVLREDVPRATHASRRRLARRIARSRRHSVVVEDWITGQRYMLTPHGAVREPPQDWMLGWHEFARPWALEAMAR